MMRLQLMLMSAKLKIVRLQFRNGAIWALIALFLANQIAPIVHDFKMNIIKQIIAYKIQLYNITHNIFDNGRAYHARW